MRFFVFIFSIYILALSLVPCNDVYNGHNREKTVAAYSQSHGKADKNDTCTPFCTCSCCNISASPETDPIKICFEKTLSLSIVKFPLGNITIFSNYNGSIWQPPKMNA